MEILIAVVALAIAGYFGYQYYQAKKAAPDIYDLPEAAEVKVEVTAVEAKAEAVIAPIKVEAKKAAPKKAPAKKAVAKKDETKAPAKKPAAKKKPNIKIAK